MISLDQVVRRNEKTASRVLAGEAIVLTPQDSKIHSFEEPTVKEIVAQIRSEFEVSEEQAQKDVIAFLGELAAKGMVTWG
jgi:hypothetical protein